MTIAKTHKTLHIGFNLQYSFSEIRPKQRVPGRGTPILGHIRDVRPEWVSFPGRKPSDGCRFLTKKLRMGYNSDIILPGNGWLSSKLNKTYCFLVNFFCKSSENGSVFVYWWASFSLRMGQFFNPVATHPRTNEVEVPPPPPLGKGTTKASNSDHNWTMYPVLWHHNWVNV